MKMTPDPTQPDRPEMPGQKWHKKTYEESLNTKPRVTAPDDAIPDDSGWASQDDSGYAN